MSDNKKKNDLSKIKIIIAVIISVAGFVLIFLIASAMNEHLKLSNNLKIKEVKIEYGASLSEDPKNYINDYKLNKEENSEFKISVKEHNDINMLPAGEYTLLISFGDENTEIPLYIEDTVKPEFTLSTEQIIICEGSQIDLYKFFTATDNVHGKTQEAKIKIDEMMFDADVPGNYKIEVTATDVNGLESVINPEIIVLSVEQAFNQTLSSYPDDSAIACPKLDEYKAQKEQEQKEREEQIRIEEERKAAQEAEEKKAEEERLKQENTAANENEEESPNLSNAASAIPTPPENSNATGGEGASSEGNGITVEPNETYDPPKEVIHDELTDEELSAATDIFNAIINQQTEMLNYRTDTINNYDSAHNIEEALKNTFGLDTSIFNGIAKVNAQGYIDGANTDNNIYLQMTILNPASIYKQAEAIHAQQTEANKAVYAAGLITGMSEKEAVRLISNYIIGHMDYSNQGNEAQEGFLTGNGSCRTYAKMFQEMCNEVGIQCEYTVGYAGGGSQWGKHAWNKVCIGGAWYWIDTCWMDTGRTNTYYLTSQLWSDHIIS